MTDPDTRQEAVERAAAAFTEHDLFFRSKRRGIARLAIDASGLLEANNQLRQRLTEAEGLLARLVEAHPDSNAHVAYRAYRTKYTPEPPE